MYIFIIGCILAILTLLMGSFITWRIARSVWPDRLRPVLSIFATLALIALIISGSYFLQPKPCTQGIASQYSGPPNCVTGTILLGGSTALQPFAKRVADTYMGYCHASTITVTGGDSNKGLNDVENSTITIADSDLLAAPAMTGLEDHEVVAAVFVVLVNPEVGIDNLTSSQLQAIYNGTAKNWQNVGGPNIPITVYHRSEGSGTRYTFDRYVLPQNTERISNQTILDDPRAMVTTVETTRGAIGYAAYDDVYTYAPDMASSLIIGIDGTRPNYQLPMNIAQNAYKFWSIEHMYTNGPATGLARAFLNYMGSNQVNEIASDLDYVNLSQVSSDALAAHCSQ